MKIVFYAPDTALPEKFTAAQCQAFRDWALTRLDHAFINAEATVSPESLIDSTSQMVVVEGGSPGQARAAYDMTSVLLGQFITIQGIQVKPPMVKRSWIGGLFKWENE